MSIDTSAVTVTESAEIVALRAENAALRAARMTPVDAATVTRKVDPFIVRIDVLYAHDAVSEPVRILRFVDTTTGVETAYWINGRHDSELNGEKRSGKRASFFLSPINPKGNA
jgi:hypothetical protein